jgi:ABC-type transport system involved in multi-copper enzyme maturation permease subunit
MSSPLAAAVHNEFSKYARQPFSYLGVVLVVVLAGFFVKNIHLVAGTAENLNGFRVVIVAATGAFTSIVPVFALIFASVLVASETTRGTYRNVLARPISRTQFLTAKLLSAFGYAFLLAFLSVLATTIITLFTHPFGAIVDCGDEVYSFWHMLGVSLLAFLITLVPLFAIVSYGFFVSTVARSLTSALAFGVGLVFAIEPIKHRVRVGDWNLSDYIPTSYLDKGLKVADQAAQGLDYEWLRGTWLASDIGWGLTLSIITILVFVGASYAVFLRRDLNFS